jgi:TRAP transporter TAXI family solute receptor
MIRAVDSAPQQARPRRLRRALASVGLAAAALLGAPLSAQPMSGEEFADKFMQMATGSSGGAFRPIGESVCEAVNKDRRATLVRCVAVATAGSTFNINAVANGAMQLGISQEDLAAKLYRDPQKPSGQQLRVVAMLHASPIAVMVRKAAGITELPQIAGKTMNLGNRGSGQFTITAAILRALDLRPEDFSSVSYLATSEFEQAFCDKKVDVLVEAVAHPSPLFERLLACGGQFIDMPAPVVARMIADNPFLTVMDIAAKTYDSQPVKVSTLGMRNVLTTSAQVNEEAVFRLTTSLLQREAELRSSQALLGSMPPMAQTGQGTLPAPLHPGVTRALESARRLAAQ